MLVKTLPCIDWASTAVMTVLFLTLTTKATLSLRTRLSLEPFAAACATPCCKRAKSCAFRVMLRLFMRAWACAENFNSSPPNCCSISWPKLSCPAVVLGLDPWPAVWSGAMAGLLLTPSSMPTLVDLRDVRELDRSRGGAGAARIDLKDGRAVLELYPDDRARDRGPRGCGAHDGLVDQGCRLGNALHGDQCGQVRVQVLHLRQAF